MRFRFFKQWSQLNIREAHRKEKWDLRPSFIRQFVVSKVLYIVVQSKEHNFLQVVSTACMHGKITLSITRKVFHPIIFIFSVGIVDIRFQNHINGTEPMLKVR